MTTMKLIKRIEAAAMLNVLPQTLAVWHSTGRYKLPVVKVGRLAMYRLDDIERFLASRRVDHGADSVEQDR